MSRVIIPIPSGKVLHWKLTERGWEMEFLRFLTPSEAKARTYNRKDAA